jgi:hypothetical protein
MRAELLVLPPGQVERARLAGSEYNLPSLFNTWPSGSSSAQLSTICPDSCCDGCGAGRGLIAGTKDRAVEALQRMRQLGVLHGDLEQRNAVRREADGEVLWLIWSLPLCDRTTSRGLRPKQGRRCWRCRACCKGKGTSRNSAPVALFQAVARCAMLSVMCGQEVLLPGFKDSTRMSRVARFIDTAKGPRAHRTTSCQFIVHLAWVLDRVKALGLGRALAQVDRIRGVRGGVVPQRWSSTRPRILTSTAPKTPP